jgi:hypothetical protein
MSRQRSTLVRYSWTGNGGTVINPSVTVARQPAGTVPLGHGHGAKSAWSVNAIEGSPNATARSQDRCM